MCAIRLAGCAPADLLEHEDEELLRDEAEGTRVAYVAATRARDLLVVPAVGDEEREGWIQPLNAAIYPPKEDAAATASSARLRGVQIERFGFGPSQAAAPERARFVPVCTCANWILLTPSFILPRAARGRMKEGVQEFSVVWWDPRALKLGAEAPLGIRRPELIVKDVAPDIVESGLAAYNSWRERRQQAIALGSQSSVAVRTVTQMAKPAGDRSPDLKLPPVEIVELPRAANRPSGPRFGALVHAVLASVPLDGDLSAIQRLATIHGRILGAASRRDRCRFGKRAHRPRACGLRWRTPSRATRPVPS